MPRCETGGAEDHQRRPAKALGKRDRKPALRDHAIACRVQVDQIRYARFLYEVKIGRQIVEVQALADAHGE